MALPASANALKRLGLKISRGEDLSDSEAELLNDFIAACDAPMVAAAKVVQLAGYAPTTRLKTRTTLMDKLRREPEIKLPSIQDVAGLRVVVEDRVDQDEAVSRIEAALIRAGCLHKTRDRRTEPSFGYRAVHIVARVAGVPVEIQVRTELQDAWAQRAEQMGDYYGRQIRYGGEPDPGATPAATAHRSRLVAHHRGKVSSEIARLEEAHGVARRSRERLDAAADEVEALRRSGGDVELELPGGGQQAGEPDDEAVRVLDRYDSVMARAEELSDRIITLQREHETRLAALATVTASLKEALRAEITREETL